MHSVIRLLIVSMLLTLVPMSTHAQDTDDICATVIVPLIQQSGLDPLTSAPVFGCDQENSRTWSMRTVASIRDENYTGTLNDRGRSLLQLVDTMSMDQAFFGVVQFERSSSTLYAVGVGNVMDPIDISTEGVGTAPNWLNNYVDGYTQAMQTYLTRTAGQMPDLVEYMLWFMSRRDVTLTSMVGNMNPMAGNAFLSNWGYQQFPWFWQLADQEAIFAYTGEETDNSMESSNRSSNTSLNPTFSPSQVAALPGDQVEITISVPMTTFRGSFALSVTIPAGIELLDVPLCRLSETCSDGSLDMDVDDHPDGSTLVTMSGLLYDDPATLALGLRISQDAIGGSSLSVRAELSFGSRSAPSNVPAESMLKVLIGETASRSSAVSDATKVPTDAADTVPDTYLTLTPSEVQARVGDTVVLDLAYARLQGVQSVAFMASSEGAFIANLPRAFIDEIGDAACSPGHEGDIVPPADRATELGTVADFPPAHLELAVNSDVQPGDRLTVCVEMIGFSGDTELFAWNAEAVIEIVE